VARKATPRKRARKAPQKKTTTSWLRRVVRFTLLLIVALGLSGAAGVAGIFWYYSLDLPRILKREDFRPAQISRVYSADGKVIDEAVAPDGRRTVVPFDQISKHMRDAILAAEDADFYRHQGLDYMGMVRALYYAIRFDRVQGASTITQQVVKNLVLTPEKSLKRKVQEIMLARRLEQYLAKDDILYIYLNQIYFGHGNYGVEEASRFYFAKPAAKLSLADAALLAGVVQSPERHSPRKHPKRAQARRQYVLEQMWKKGFVSEAEARKAMQAPLPKTLSRAERDPWLDRAPYYTAHVTQLLDKQFGKDWRSQGLRVTTSLDTKAQASAAQALQDGLESIDKRKGYYRPVRKLTWGRIKGFRGKQARRVRAGKRYEAVVLRANSDGVTVAVGPNEGSLSAASKRAGFGVDRKAGNVFSRGDVLWVVVESAGATPRFKLAPGPQAAIVSIDVRTRHVEALVGGYDFAESSFNRATQAKRQTGSSFKPIVYGSALQHGITTPAKVWLDAPTPFPIPGKQTWNPRNSDGKYLGPVTTRRALAKSRNVVAVRLLDAVGIPRAQKFARDLGLTSPLVDNLTMGLGSSEISVLEMTGAYATLASLGHSAEPIFIVQVRDSWGQVLYEGRAEKRRTLPEAVTWLTVDMMKSVVEHGTAAKVGKGFGRPAAGKTGTTNKARDAWFLGFTPTKVCGVWVGNDDNSPLGKRMSGGSAAAPIWLDHMKSQHAGLPKKDWDRPNLGIVDARIDRATGLLAPDGAQNALTEYFLTGSAPTEYAPEADEDSASDFWLGQGGDDDADAEAPPE
jgi:penicillin-binding protein 1A